MSWQIDYGHAHIGFTGRHLMVSIVRGEFERFRGTVEFDEHDVSRSKAAIQIEAASVNTRNSQRDAHFRTADFFDVEKYPYITFKSKRVIMRDANHGQLIGDLTIRNITREVVLESEYGGVRLAGGGLVAGDEITLTIDLELTRPVEAVVPAQAGGTTA